jgi:hypothetical protein
LLLVIFLAVGIAVPATADPPAEEVGWTFAEMTDADAGGQTGTTGVDGGAIPQYRYKYVSRCKVGETCTAQERICRTANSDVGAWYVVTRIEIVTGEATDLGAMCLAPEEAEEQDVIVITPAMVRREFERLSWPTSELQLQPPDGQTLINFDTNFFTDNTTPTTRTVTLLGQRVEIEATPTSYTWDFGDGTSTTTSSPGAAYPDLDVTHDYADPGRVSPSVATTYQGRYRINGGGWQQIPGSLTLEGEPESLRVRSASPRLVGTSY